MRLVKLKDIAEIFSGYAFSSKDLTTRGIPLVKIGNIQNRKVVKECSSCYPMKLHNERLNKYFLQEQDILIAMTGAGSVGRIGKMFNQKKDNFLVNQRVAIVRINKDKINPEYVYQIISNNKYETILYNLALGAGQPNLSPSDIGNIEIPIYGEINNNKIAKVLSNYDNLIENNNKRIKILEEMAQKIYKEWFVDFKFPGHETTTFKDSELGKIPKLWNIEKINNYFGTCLGGTPSRNNPKYWNGNISWLNSGKTNELRVISESEFITDLGLAKSSTKLMPKYSTILAITGATLGQVSMIGKEMCANQSVVGITSNKYPMFLFYMMKHRISDLIMHASGGAQQHINKDIVNETKFILPETSIIESFEELAMPINKQIFSLLYKNEKLKQTRDILLPRLISGEIDVENMEIV